MMREAPDQNGYEAYRSLVLRYGRRDAHGETALLIKVMNFNFGDIDAMEPPTTQHPFSSSTASRFQSSVAFVVASCVPLDRVGCDVGSARRRKERRLRSWLRHERMTVATELAAALHHSRDGWRATNDGLRARKTVSSGGMRPAPLSEVARPQGAAATFGWLRGYQCSSPSGVHAVRGADGADGTTPPEGSTQE